MDDSAFQKELNKYKVVRPADFHKPRLMRQRTEPRTAPRTSAPTQQSRERESSQRLANVTSGDFWELLSTANASMMTTAESIKFIEAIKQEHSLAKGKVNLQDMDMIAAELKA
jgi:hypothetical protein